MKKYTIEELMKNTSFDSVIISDDGKDIIYSSDKDGYQNAYTLNLSTGEEKQLTNLKETVMVNAILPGKADSFLFSMDQGGNELTHIYMRNDDGSIKDLTPQENSKMNFYRMDENGEGFLYYSNQRNKRFFDIRHFNFKNDEDILVFENNEYDNAVVSHDLRYTAVSKSNNDNDKDVFLIDNRNGEIKNLIDKNGKEIASFISGFSKDSKKIYIQSDKDGEFLDLMEYDIEKDSLNKIYSTNWDVGFVYSIPSAFETADRKHLIFYVNENASMMLKVMNLTDKKILNFNSKLPSVSYYTNISISKNSGKIAFITSDSASPTNICILDIEEDRFEIVTNSLNPSIDKKDLVSCEKISYTAIDGNKIPALLYKPHECDGEKIPALVYVHGGPGGQSVDEYNAQFQYILNNKVAVLAVNNRGSSGYGKSFYKGAYHMHGEADLQDCVDAVEYLKSLDYVNPEKTGIIGASYGGYMVLAALAFKPETFKFGIDVFGVSNWLRTLSEIPPWWGNAREVLFDKIGNPETEPEYLRKISPLFHADKITKPLMVLQGSNDPRVLKIESDEIVQKVSEKGITVEYVVFEDEGHGFRKVKNQIAANKKIVEFINNHL